MRRTLKISILFLCFLTMINQISSKANQKSNLKEAELKAMIDRFAPVALQTDLTTLSSTDRQVLSKLTEATKILDTLYLRQVWVGNEPLLKKLKAQPTNHTTLGDQNLTNLIYQYFVINKGPWSRLDQNKSFIDGVPQKPLGANFYPIDATKEELEKWMTGLSEKEKQQAQGFYTVVRRDKNKKLKIVPYNKEYETELKQLNKLLMEASRLTSNQTLKDFLSKRAKAFLTNDYYESDVAWMNLDSNIEPTIGPYEVYEDELFNFKAAFEAFITIRDENETNKLKKFGQHLQDIENHLPIDDKYKNPKLGEGASIRVVNVIASGGEANHGVQTAAYNLPNDERVVKEKGSKRVMLKNIQEAKFNKVLIPIAQMTLNKEDLNEISFEAFFTHILMHELMHGLGPQNITINGKETTVRKELKEIYSTIEEAKADISGLFALQYLIDKGVLDKKLEKEFYVTYLASAFRSIRFGINEAHGQGMALQLNYLLNDRAIVVNDDGTFSINFEKVKESVAGLTKLLMTYQATGNYEGCQKLLAEQAVISPAIEKALSKLNNIPVDISPEFSSVRMKEPADFIKGHNKK